MAIVWLHCFKGRGPLRGTQLTEQPEPASPEDAAGQSEWVRWPDLDTEVNLTRAGTARTQCAVRQCMTDKLGQVLTRLSMRREKAADLGEGTGEGVEPSGAAVGVVVVVVVEFCRPAWERQDRVAIMPTRGLQLGTQPHGTYSGVGGCGGGGDGGCGGTCITIGLPLQLQPHFLFTLRPDVRK